MDHWQLALCALAALFLLFQAISGWRQGLVRQIFRIGALAAAYATAYFFSRQAVPFLRPLHFPDFILQIAAGLVIGFFVYVVIRLICGILFRKTSDQEFGLVWFFYGVTGALLGIAFGLVFVTAGAVTIRFLGTLADGNQDAAPTHVAPLHTPARRRHPFALHSPARPTPPENPAVMSLVAMKRSLEKGIPGEILQTIDPIPKNIYAIAGKVGHAVSNPDAINRFFLYPGAQDLANNPEIAKLRDDPEIAKALRAHAYTSLLRNEHIIQVVNDPKIAELLKKFDLEKALDFANGSASQR